MADSGERLKWRVLKLFHALPTERRVQEMKERDYLWCVLNMMADDEQALEELCPSCRSQVERGGCPICGRTTAGSDWGENESFDLARFEALRKGRRD